MPSVGVPALVLQARDDDVTSPRNAEYVARHLGGPVRLEYLDDCYHMITIDQQRDAVIRLSAEFFWRCLKRPKPGPVAAEATARLLPVNETR